MSCLIEADGLTFQYPDGVHALRDVNLHVRHGENVGIVGPNGAGKTTLFMVLSGIADRFEGSVRVAGCDLGTAEGRREVHRKLGIVFQNADDQLFNTTVLEDVSFGPVNLGLDADEVAARVDEAMLKVGLNGDMRDRVPFHLSGGEKRRVALAGILAMRPNVLLLDEPSSDLDPRGRRELIQILRGFSLTRMISSHDLEFILETCGRVVVFDGGRIRADGPAREILSDADLMEAHGLEVPLSLRLAAFGRKTTGE